MKYMLSPSRLQIPQSSYVSGSPSAVGPPITGEWDFAGVDTQYSTHGIHTYLAAMIPQLARRLIDMYVPEKGSVLDPFSGGGTVLVEAIRSGRPAAGCDINPLAVLVSKAKTRHIDTFVVLKVLSEILERSAGYQGEPLNFKKSEYIDFWFKPYMMKPLTALRYAIDEVTASDESLNNLIRTIFSATTRDVSLTYRNEIRLRRMREDERRRFNPDVFQRFHKRAVMASSRVGELPAEASSIVKLQDATRLEFADNEFSTVLCSPPYGDERNGVPYTQFAKNMLLWLGYTTGDIQESKRLSLGWYKNGKQPPSSSTLVSALEKISAYADSVREAIAFYADYRLALAELARVVSDRVIIVIGQRVLRNTVFDNGSITAELMNDVGMNLEAHYVRRLPTKRLPRMREFGAAINRESILVFRK